MSARLEPMSTCPCPFHVRERELLARIATLEEALREAKRADADTLEVSIGNARWQVWLDHLRQSAPNRGPWPDDLSSTPPRP